MVVGWPTLPPPYRHLKWRGGGLDVAGCKLQVENKCQVVGRKVKAEIPLEGQRASQTKRRGLCWGLLAKNAKGITEKCVALALEGDPVALKLCIDRLSAAPKDSPVAFEMPAINEPADAVKAMGAIATAVAAGQITPGQAADVSRLIEVWRPGRGRGGR